MARLAPRTVAFLCALIALLATASNASAAQQVIKSAGPLTSIYLNDDLSCSLDRNGQTQIFGTTDFGSCGTYLATGGTLYGPAPQNPGQPDTSAAPFTPQSQRAVGSGSVETVVSVPGTPLQITQTDTYVPGQDFYSTDVQVTNTDSSVAQAVVLYHAADCFLRGDDAGYGATGSGGSVYCSRQPNV